MRMLQHMTDTSLSLQIYTGKKKKKRQNTHYYRFNKYNFYKAHCLLISHFLCLQTTAYLSIINKMPFAYVSEL